MSRPRYGQKTFTKNPTFIRFVGYHTPYTGSILLATVFAIVVAVCELGTIQIFADTVNALKVVDGNLFDAPVSIRYFQFQREGLVAFEVLKYH